MEVDVHHSLGGTLQAMSSGLSIDLHPLVIINISDHYTRIKAQSNSPTTTGRPWLFVFTLGIPNFYPPVLGVLLGHQNGRNVELTNSFEVSHEVKPDGFVEVSKSYYLTKLEQCASLFSRRDGD